ncbi:MAG: hypothetical protein QW128_07900 [Thermoprotei archaeon]
MEESKGISTWKLLLSVVLVLLPGFLSFGFRILYSHVNAFRNLIDKTGLSPTNWAFIIGIVGFVFGVYYLNMALHKNEIILSAPFRNLLKIFSKSTSDRGE